MSNGNKFNDTISDIDDTKTVVTRSGTTSGDFSRTKLLQRDYSTDQCLDILSNLGLGYTPDQASKKAKSLTENVKSVKLIDPRKMSVGSERLSENQIGRNIFEAVRNMIVQGSEPLVAVVKTNVSLDIYLSDVQSKMYELEESISQLELCYTEPVEPKTERLSLRLDVDVQKKKEELRQKAQQSFQERIKQESESHSKSTAGTPKAKSNPKQRGKAKRVVYDSSESETERTAPTATTETWLTSMEFKFYEMAAENYVTTATFKYKEDLLELYNTYDQQVEQKAQAMRELKLNRDAMRRQQVLEIFVSEL